MQPAVGDVEIADDELGSRAQSQRPDLALPVSRRARLVERDRVMPQPVLGLAPIDEVEADEGMDGGKIPSGHGGH